MTDKPGTTHPSSVPEDNRGIQPGLILTGVFGAFIGMGAVILTSKAAAKKGGQDNTPSGP